MGRTDSRRRALFLLIVFATVGSALLARLAYWQVGQRDRLADEALQQTTMREETPSKRGEIYDRTGRRRPRDDDRAAAARLDAVGDRLASPAARSPRSSSTSSA